MLSTVIWRYSKKNFCSPTEWRRQATNDNKFILSCVCMFLFFQLGSARLHRHCCCFHSYKIYYKHRNVKNSYLVLVPYVIAIKKRMEEPANKWTNERASERVGKKNYVKAYSYHFCGQIQVCRILAYECVLVEEFATTAIFYGCRISFWVCPANETTTTTTHTHQQQQ